MVHYKPQHQSQSVSAIALLQLQMPRCDWSVPASQSKAVIHSLICHICSEHPPEPGTVLERGIYLKTKNDLVSVLLILIAWWGGNIRKVK